MYLFFTTFGLFLIAINTMAQDDSWKLERCLDSALKNNNAILQVELDRKIAQIQLNQRKYDFTPQISVGANQTYSFGRNLDPISNEFTQSTRQNSGFGINGNLTLFSGLSRYYEFKKSSIALNNESYNKKIAERNVKLEVYTFYLQAVLSYELFQLSSKHLTYTIQEEKKMNQLIAANAKIPADLVAILSQKSRDKLQISKHQNDHKLALNELRFVMQFKDTSGFQIDTSTTFILNDSSIFIRFENIPELEKSAAEVELALLNKKISASSYLPSLSLQGNIGSGYSDSFFILDPVTGSIFLPSFNTQLRDNISQSITLSLNIPIYNQHNTKTATQLRAIELEKLVLENQRIATQLEQNILKTRADMNVAKAELDGAVKLLSLAQKDFDISRLKYETGTIDYSTFLTKKDLLYQAQSSLIQRKYSYYFARRILELYAN